MENQNFTLTTTQILNDLKNGLTRESIKEKYGMTNRELKEIFQHPDLKGRKTRPANRFTLISDTPSEEMDIPNPEVLDSQQDPQEPMDTPSQEILDSQDYLQTDPQDSSQEEGVLETTEFDPEPQTIEDTIEKTVRDSWEEESDIEKSTFTI